MGMVSLFKKAVLLILMPVMISCSLVYGQEPVKDDKNHIIFKDYYEDGQLMWEKSYGNEKLDGIAEECCPDGNLNYEGRFKNNELTGIINEYYISGALMREWDYRDQKQGIVVVKEYYENGQLLSQKAYKNNLLAKAKQYDKYGKVILEQEY